jgi:hypothetical protein
MSLTEEGLKKRKWRWFEAIGKSIENSSGQGLPQPSSSIEQSFPERLGDLMDIAYLAINNKDCLMAKSKNEYKQLQEEIGLLSNILKSAGHDLMRLSMEVENLQGHVHKANRTSFLEF